MVGTQSQEPQARGPAARYLYAVIPRVTQEEFGTIGILGSRVYPIAHRDLCVLVHDCSPQPYLGDAETMSSWAKTHNDVVEAAWREVGAVLPVRFDVIVKPDHQGSAEEKVQQWLERGYHRFLLKLEEFQDKVEMGVQVFWDLAPVTERIVRKNPDIRALERDIASASPGIAYFYHHKITQVTRGALERKAREDYKAYYERLERYAEDIQVNNLKRDQDKQMIMDVSLLVRRENISALGVALGEFQEEGIEVRYTGPWPPYSFAASRASGQLRSGLAT